MCIIRPQDCAIAFGIPTCQHVFVDQRDNMKREHDYVRYSKYPEYTEYYSGFVRFLDELEPGLQDIGVRLAYDVTPWDLTELFQQYRVVILFSHWTDADPEFPLGAVELGEGLVDIDTIVEAVPQDYDGFLDLCTCSPPNLIDALLYARSRCRLKYTEKEDAKPDLWLYFYAKLFQLLHEKPMSYPDALARTRSNLIGEAQDGDTA